MRKIVFVSFIAFYAISDYSYGQEHHQDTEDSHDELKHHGLSFEFGYTHIPDGFEEVMGDQAIWVPTLGLAYVHHFNHKWGAGMTVNLEIAKYQIEFNMQDLTRENVLIIAALGYYELLPNWSLFLGPGIELEKHHNFAVLRFGTDYVIPLKNNWILTPVLTFDHKFDYTSWEVALAIGKRF